MSDAKSGSLAFTLSTWVYVGHIRGRELLDPMVLAACEQVTSSPDTDAAGQALASLLESRTADDFDAVVALATLLFGAAVETTPGGERESRIRDARRYQFRTQLPWLARIVDRTPEGEVRPHWVLIEQVSDTVRVMDPYPWDDVDEEVDVPLVDFMVRWELAGGQGLRFV